MELKRIVARDEMRWGMEPCHKALQRGAGVEESQLEKGFRIENLLAGLAVLAVRRVPPGWRATDPMNRWRPSALAPARWRY